MANERITEDIVRNHFKNDPLFKSVKFEEQKSYNKRIIDLLQNASKSGKGVGKPEFIISFPSGNIDYLLVIECKASVTNHRSEKVDNPKDFAVDGVLHYAKALSKEFDVVAIAVSGQTEQELLVSHFVWKKGEAEFAENKEDKKLLSVNDYIKSFNNEQFADNLRSVDIIQKAIFLNEEYQAYSITETTRCTMVSAILLSLLHEPFRISYKTYPTAESLGKAMLSAIENVLAGNSIFNQNAMIGEYSKILNEPLFKQKTIKHKKKKEHEQSVEVAKEMIDYLHQNVYPLMDMEQSGFDVLGRFYTEFIRYAGSEQSQGLVLTPAHITDLFCDLANVTANDIIYDPCCGTGGFLIAGMKRMFELTGSDENKKQNIKNKQLVGVELRPSMFTYACSNMMLRGDGKSNIYCDDCFAFADMVAETHKPTIAFLNPPYDVGVAGQMLFIEHALNTVTAQNGTVVAIVQMSCGIKNEKELIAVKKRILDKHHLKAVLSMPDELFNPTASVVTCVMVFEANKTNKGRETWFGYFKDDKFEKRKNQGRIDARGLYKEEKKRWLDAYHNSKELAGLSVKQEVKGEDEWCAEAYMETDYPTMLRQSNFEKKIRHYLAHLIVTDILPVGMLDTGHSNKSVQKLDATNWKWFRYDEVFTIKKGFYNKKPDENTNGTIPFIGATDSNNGITSWCDYETIELASKTGDGKNAPIEEKIFKPNCITVSNNGSVGFAFYQPKEFTCTHDVNPLYLKNKELNVYIAMFLCSLIEMEQYRWAFGRKWRPVRMPKSLIKLPITQDGTPDWQFMEDYIKSLPYSKAI
jgi:type I restriction-modification system DNA methylase subunit